MDDIRRPHQPQRRDYTAPVHRQPPEHVTDLRPPAQPEHQPTHQPQQHQHPRPNHHQPPHHQPQHHEPTQPAAQPAPAHQPSYAPSQHHQPASHEQPRSADHQPAVHKKSRRGLKLAIIILIPFIAAGLFAAGYSLKSTKDSNGIPPAIVKQANFDLYFPSPMPNGYIYMQDTATFQIGQVFYKFSNGKKRVTVNEQPAGQKKPDLSQLPGYTQFDSPVGKAAFGTTLGEPTAVVVAGNTVITMNSVGGVSQQELQTAINSFKNIGQNPKKT
jgi:hypothetical protein